MYAWFAAEHGNKGIGYAAARMLREKGFEELKACSPPLAHLTSHLMHFLYKIKSDHGKAHLSPGEVYHEEDKQNWGPEPQADELESLPFNIYGLRSTSKIHRSSARIPLNGVDLLGSKAKYPWAATDYLSKAISRIVESKIMGPSLIKYDKLFPKAPKAGTTEEDVIARAVLRGALLSLVVKGVGTDAVLASDRIVPLIKFPNFIAGESGSNKLRDVVKKVLKQMESLSERALSAMAAIVDTETENAFKEMGTILHDCVVKYTSPREAKRGDRYQRTGRSLQLGALPLDGVLPSGTPNIGMINFLLRESLQERKGLGAADEILGRILRGQHATRATTAQGYNPDHTNPSRHHNQQSLLLEKHLGQSPLTGPFGLSNLLVFFGTGQGWKTAGFLEYMGRTEQGIWSESVADVSRKFNSAMVRNMDQIMAAVLHYDNALQWGTANNHLLAQPTIPGQNGRRQTLEEKFRPYFQQNVLDVWTAFLGGMAGRDRRTWEGEKKSWKEALEMLDRLKISGIAGLTALQLVNSLALLGVVTMPDVTTLADWIWARPQLGAFRGLERLGFTLINTNATRFAFDLVYRHIATTMSKEDQDMIGFSTIFVEHLLCKVIRWDRRLKEDGCNQTLNSLLDMALEAKAKGMVPEIAFPCSWKVSNTVIEEALARHAYVSSTACA